MNSINNISFGKTYNAQNTENKDVKRKKALKIAAGIGVAVAGGALLYKNRNAKPVLKFRNFVNEGVLAPLKEKNVPLKKKISNVWGNIKSGVKDLNAAKKVAKPEASLDTIEIKNVQNKPKATASVDESKILSQTEAVIADPKKVSSKPAQPVADKPKTEKKDKKIKVLGKKSTVKSDKPAKKPDISQASGKDNKKNPKDLIGEARDSIIKSAQTHARDLKVAAGTAAVVTGGAVAGGHIGDTVREKKEKDFSIAFNGEEFKGELKDGMAFDENEKPLNGTLEVLYGSGKKVLIQYRNGLLQQSAIFSAPSNNIPRTIRSYNADGKIAEKHDKIRPDKKGGDKSFKSGITQRYYDDSILRTSTETLDKKGNNFVVSYFARNIDGAGKIKGKPIKASAIQTQKLPDGSTVKKLFVPYNGEERVIRTSKKAKDGSVEITLSNMEEKEIAKLSTGVDKKAVCYRHFVDGGENDGVVAFENGKVLDINYGSVGKPLTLLSEYNGLNEKYKAQDGSIIEITYDYDQVTSIASYSSDDAGLFPQTEMLFKDGIAVCETFYDEKTGDIIFTVNHH